MTKLAHEWVRTSDPVIRSPARYRWTLDESVFGRKVKYNRGNPRGQKIWIFGMIDRVANNLIIYPVDHHAANTLQWRIYSPPHLPWVSTLSPRSRTLPPPGLVHHRCIITSIIKFCNS